MRKENLLRFLKLAQYGNFSKAAKKLFISQPALSMQINNLEEHFGCKLFDRKGKNVILTPAGAIFKKYCEKMLALYDQAEEEINEILSHVRGELKIGASLTIGGHYLPGFLKCFSEKYPDVRINMVINNTEEILFHLMEDDIDLGVVEGNVKDVEAHVFARDEMVLVVPTDHELAARNEIDAKTLCQYPLVVREKGSGTRRVLEIKLENNNIPSDTLNIAMELGSAEAIKNAVREGIGIAVLSRWAVKEEVKNEIFKEILITDLKLERTFKYIFNTHRYRSLKAKAFVKELISYENSQNI